MTYPTMQTPAVVEPAFSGALQKGGPWAKVYDIQFKGDDALPNAKPFTATLYVHALNFRSFVLVHEDGRSVRFDVNDKLHAAMMALAKPETK